MANEEHVALVKQGISAWNAWRHKSDVRPDLSNADLSQMDLRGATLGYADLSGADLREANLSEASLSVSDLRGADLRWANLSNAHARKVDLRGARLQEANVQKAYLGKANLSDAELSKANLSDAYFGEGNFSRANLSEANLSRTGLFQAVLREVNLSRAELFRANLCAADLSKADLQWASLLAADLSAANLTGANLSGASLINATLVNTNLTDADLTGCWVYGVSAWTLNLENARQQNLVITNRNEPKITVDNIEVAQFIYLMLHNQKVRDVIDTITSKAVLILGRFTIDRKAVLDGLRDELRKRNYLPILFDFEKPASLDTDETITLLARMAKFIIADISDAKSVLQELRAIVPDLPSVPVQPIILATQEEPGMFDFYRHRPSFLSAHRYATPEQLLCDLEYKVIRPAEQKVLELRAGTGQEQS
ncbi:pentapeptide repeat-containing protein [Bradyrhizobium sp. USDA 3315]